MPVEPSKPPLKGRVNKAGKFETRRQQLAAAAIATMGEFGYANTSLRDIAAKSDFSLGTLHYYFADKDDLISYCVLGYKRHFINEMNRAIDRAADLATLIEDFINGFVKTVSLDSESHRLWYDIRSQAMFSPAFRPLVFEIDRSLLAMINHLTERVRAFTGAAMQIPVSSVYWALDGMFQYFLLARLDGIKDCDSEYKRYLTVFFKHLLHTMQARKGADEEGLHE